MIELNSWQLKGLSLIILGYDNLEALSSEGIFEKDIRSLVELGMIKYVNSIREGYNKVLPTWEGRCYMANNKEYLAGFHKYNKS